MDNLTKLQPYVRDSKEARVISCLIFILLGCVIITSFVLRLLDNGAGLSGVARTSKVVFATIWTGAFVGTWLALLTSQYRKYQKSKVLHGFMIFILWGAMFKCEVAITTVGSSLPRMLGWILIALNVFQVVWYVWLCVKLPIRADLSAEVSA